MNSRKIFRLYAQSQGLEATEFVRIEDENYTCYSKLYTKADNGNQEVTDFTYKNLTYWLLNNKNIKISIT